MTDPPFRSGSGSILRFRRPCFSSLCRCRIAGNFRQTVQWCTSHLGVRVAWLASRLLAACGRLPNQASSPTNGCGSESQLPPFTSSYVIERVRLLGIELQGQPNGRPLLEIKNRPTVIDRSYDRPLFLY